jgi:hypothetical protein
VAAFGLDVRSRFTGSRGEWEGAFFVRDRTKNILPGASSEGAGRCHERNPHLLRNPRRKYFWYRSSGTKNAFSPPQTSRSPHLPVKSRRGSTRAIRKAAARSDRPTWPRDDTAVSARGLRRSSHQAHRLQNFGCRGTLIHAGRQRDGRDAVAADFGVVPMHGGAFAALVEGDEVGVVR